MNLKKLEYTALINAFSILRLPLLAACLPQITELSQDRTAVRIRLGWRTRNHLGVMYFGALAMGAELSIALKAIEEIRASRQSIDFIFKDFRAEFLKRADGHVEFICEQAAEVADLIRRAKDSGERLHGTFEGYAVVPSRGTDPVMTYSLTLSVKNRKGSRSKR